jgi:hypothetical protein
MSDATPHTDCNFNLSYPIFLADNAKYIGGMRNLPSEKNPNVIFDLFKFDKSCNIKTKGDIQLNIGIVVSPTHFAQTICANSFNSYTWIVYLSKKSNEIVLSCFSLDKIQNNGTQLAPILTNSTQITDVKHIENFKVKQTITGNYILSLWMEGPSLPSQIVSWEYSQDSQKNFKFEKQKVQKTNNCHYAISNEFITFLSTTDSVWMYHNYTSKNATEPMQVPTLKDKIIQNVCFVELSDVKQGKTMFVYLQKASEESWIIHLISIDEHNKSNVVSTQINTKYKPNNYKKWSDIDESKMVRDMCARYLKDDSSVEIYLDCQMNQYGNECATTIVKYVVGYNSDKNTFSENWIQPDVLKPYCIYNIPPHDNTCLCNMCAIDFKHNHTDDQDKTIYGLQLCKNDAFGGANQIQIKSSKGGSYVPVKLSPWRHMWRLLGGIVIAIFVLGYAWFMMWIWNKRTEIKSGRTK